MGGVYAPKVYVAFQINRHQLYCLMRTKECLPKIALKKNPTIFPPKELKLLDSKKPAQLRLASESVFKPLPPSAQLTLA